MEKIVKTMHITAKGPTKPKICAKKAPNKSPANYPNSSANSIHVTTRCSSFLCCAVASARAAVCIRPAPMPSIILPRNPRTKNGIFDCVHSSAIIITQDTACNILPILNVSDRPHFYMRVPANTEDKSSVIE